MTAALSARHRKWFGWFRLLAAFGAVQMVIQILGFLSGILIVRHLSKSDYAWFTIANALIATLGMLADSGISSAVSAVGGTVWQDDARFGSLIRTALTLRKRFASAIVILVTPFFIWLLVKNQAPFATVTVVVVAALAGFFLQLTAGLLGVVISLRQEIRRMQLLGLLVAFLRLGLLAPACLVFIDVRVAVIVGTIALALQAWVLRRWVSASIEWRAPESAEYRTRILSVVRKQAPLTFFYCLQGQIMVWLISIFGGAQRVADIGALGRLAAIFTVISSVMTGIVVPRFARCQDRGVLKRRYWQVVLGYATAGGAFVALSAAFPRILLWVLGGRYANLEREVWLMMLSAALSAMSGSLYALTFSKAWIARAGISIPMEIVTQLVLILSFDVSTVRGVLWLSCLSPIPLIGLNMIIAHFELKKLEPPIINGHKCNLK